MFCPEDATKTHTHGTMTVTETDRWGVVEVRECSKETCNGVRFT